MQDPIKAGEVYKLDDFRERAGWGRAAMRAARKRGLRVRRLGKYVYVAGDDFLKLLDEQPRDDVQD